MLKYLLRRLLLFIPTLIIVSLLAFIISINAPGDPVERMMTTAEQVDILGGSSEVQADEKKSWTHRLGLDLPVFYISMVPLSFPDTLYRIYDPGERHALKSLILRYGNWRSIEKFHKSLNALYRSHDKIYIDAASINSYSINEIRAAINQSRINTLVLLSTENADVVRYRLNQQKQLLSSYTFFSSLRNDMLKTEESFNDIQNSSLKWKNYVPTIRLYSNNQYHRWLFGDGNWLTGEGSSYSRGLVRGDMGISYTTKRSVSTIISERLGWSLLLTLLSVILAYLISIPIGIQAARNYSSAFDRSSSVTLFILHSMPVFWVATILLFLFANPDVLPWFPASGIKPVAGYPEGASFFEKITLTAPYIILPVIAYTYSSLAFISRLTRTSMLETLKQDYVQTARAKGLPEKRVIYRHAFRNSLLPLITVFANIFPAAIGGTIILESIFTIPGMGLETYNAILAKDYPVIVGVLTLACFLTLIGYLLADILYAVADPRISFSKK